MPRAKLALSFSRIQLIRVASSPPARKVRGSRMGRGRQKAKHTKVARELKYFSPDTNYSALERELGTHAEPDFAALAAKYGTDDDLEDDLEEYVPLDEYVPTDEQKRA